MRNKETLRSLQEKKAGTAVTMNKKRTGTGGRECTHERMTIRHRCDESGKKQMWETRGEEEQKQKRASANFKIKQNTEQKRNAADFCS